MKSLKKFAKGTIIGIFVGTISLIMIYAGLIIGGMANRLPPAIVVSTLIGSITASALCIALGFLLTHRERSLVAPLVTLAIASLVVLPGNYGNGSLVPPAIYSLAILNGLTIALVTSPLCAPSIGSENRS